MSSKTKSIVCAHCHEPITKRRFYKNPEDGANLHYRCADLYRQNSEEDNNPELLKIAGKNQPTHENFPRIICEKCSGEMVKTTVPETNSIVEGFKALLKLAALLLAIGGILISFLLPPVGGFAIGFGVIMFFMVRIEDPVKVCKCTNCGFFFERD